MMTMLEARFDLDRQLLALADDNGPPLVRDVRFFPAPCDDRRSVLAVAELVDGRDLEAMFQTAAPVNHDAFDENAMREQFFAVPSGSRH